MDNTRKTLSIKQNIVWNMVGSSIGLGSQWAISILVVRLATDLSSAGLYSLAMSVFGIFAPLANFGMYTYLITDMERKNSIGEYTTLTSLTSFTALVAVSIYAIVTCRPNSWLVIWAYAFYKGIATVIDILHAEDQRAHRMDYIGISLALQGIGSLAAFCITFYLSHDLVAAILAMAGITLAVGVVYDLPRTAAISRIKLGIGKRKAFAILSGCLLIVVSSIATGAFASLPRQFLSSSLGDSALGIYASVATPVAIIQVGSAYIYNPLIGYFAESFHSGDRQRFFGLIKTTFLGIVTIGIIAFAGAAVIGKPALVLLYGSEVAAHSELLNPLIASSILLGATAFINNLLVAVRALRIMVLGSCTALVISAITSPFLIDAMGMSGATYAIMLACAGSIAVGGIGVGIQAKGKFAAEK